MKPFLYFALLVTLGSTCAQAQPIALTPRPHIDDGTFVGPKKRVPRLPGVLEQLQRNAASRSSGNQGALDFSVRGDGIRVLGVPPKSTLSKRLQNPRPPKSDIGLKLFSFGSTNRTIYGGYSLPLFRWPFDLTALSPYSAFAFKGEDHPMPNAQSMTQFSTVSWGVGPTF